MNESDLQRFHDYPIYPRDYKTLTDKRFVYVDNGEMGGTHWTCFYTKDNTDSNSHAGSAKKSFYFDSFGGAPDKFLFTPITKTNNIATVSKYKIFLARLCDSYCL